MLPRIVAYCNILYMYTTNVSRYCIALGIFQIPTRITPLGTQAPKGLPAIDNLHPSLSCSQLTVS